MRTLWIIAGMRRSGIHAVVDWLLSGINAPYVVLNNARLDRINPKEKDTTFSTGYEDSKNPHEHVVAIFEDKRLPAINRSPLVRQMSSGFDHIRRLVVIRDPYNLTASRLHRTRRGSRDTRPERVIRLWPSHAQAGSIWTRCVYNLWFADEPYRNELAEKLKLPSCPPYPEHVARAGRGSSFDGLKYDGNAAQMAVLDRWRAFTDDPQYRRIVDRPLLARLSETVCRFPFPLKGTNDDT